MPSPLLTMAFLDGIGFDPFFRGFLSVLVGVVVLIGGTYLLVATNVGARLGMMVAAAGLFGWMFLMGIIWTAYGIGWVGPSPTWELVEINIDDAAQNDDGLLFSEVEGLADLYQVDVSVDVADPDEAQVAALAKSKETELGEWRYLSTADGVRGEAQASADQYLLEEHIYDAGEYLPLQFGGFTAGGKPVLTESPSMVDRVGHFFSETFLHPVHTQELIVIQTRSIINKPAFPGQAPPTAEADPDAPLVSVVMERDRGGPLPSLISGLRFTPFVFTVANLLLFVVFAWALHNRDRREALVRASAAA